MQRRSPHRPPSAPSPEGSWEQQQWEPQWPEPTEQTYAPQNSTQPPFTLNVLTLNCWGTLGSRRRRQRMGLIGKRLALGGFDICGLTEVYYEEDVKSIVDLAGRGQLSYHHHYLSGLKGSGLIVLSRFPITDVLFYQFRLGSKLHKPLQPDWCSGRGVALARIATPSGSIDFYVCQLIGRYTPVERDEYRAVRLCQTFEMLQFMELSGHSHLLLLAADTNSTPNSLEYSLMRGPGRLRDSFSEAHPRSPGVTFSDVNPFNTSAAHTLGRIDFILYRYGSSEGRGGKEEGMVLMEAALTMKYIVYSDHFGVFAKFGNSQTAAASALPEDHVNLLARRSLILQQTLDHIIWGLSDHSNRRVWHLMRALCLLLLCCLILRWRSWGWGWLVLLLQELLPIGVACECLLAVHLTLEITCMSAIRAELLLWSARSPEAASNERWEAEATEAWQAGT